MIEQTIAYFVITLKYLLSSFI